MGLRHLVAGLACLLAACGDGALDAPPADGPAGGAPDAGTTPDADLDTIPRFTTSFTTDPSQIERISRFRSGVGHDFSDGFETCRSMKHYLCPRPCSGAHLTSWTTLPLRSPVTGTVIALFDEQSFGTQMQLQPDDHPTWVVRVFHVAPRPGLAVGAHLAAGEPIGTHASDSTMSDVSVEQRRPDGRMRRVSIFDTMTDDAFAPFLAHGIPSRAALAITAAARDADPLQCDGERFLTEGTLPAWVDLTP